jgi:hypothetical protein
MIDLNDAVNLLQGKRKELADQLAAVDKALAALSGVGGAVTTPPETNPDEPPAQAPSPIVPTRLKPPRTLSAEHKHALNEGRRKARHSRDAAAGLARDMTDAAPGLAPPSNGEGRQPRLVKRTRQ